jgi:hypothetical protein
MLPHWRRRRGLRRGGGAYRSRPKVPATLAAPKAGSRASSRRDPGRLLPQGAKTGHPGTASDGPLISTAVDRVGAVELRGGLDDDEELRYLVAEDDL